MNLHLQSSDFELFGLPERFAQDGAAIDARWKELQRQAHPDRFAAEGAAAQRVAMQWSVRINEAYKRLKDPLQRAAYLCELRGAPINAQDNTAMPSKFLIEQMEWREALEEAQDEEALERLEVQLRQSRQEVLRDIEQLLDRDNAAAAAAGQVRALMFIERFGQDVQDRFEQLGR
ncbi:Fe-S protein assembly co-chaperone HscB [Ramlibacter sp. RBP-2]|uniref:Co-chaperone protein HscB homolog n=1 Tax=Ramlibacter lithotrophicus TaxID=2606681 RepID=A0A7X6I541_9BURK|nr:Fe-S protein assembly co-chaperone HscB [Ramlibacter lithotrophicus]NKE64961.1 Fe-S protein assembly co-chaperone HscB [Ramlibacter lithotrophicus]